MKHRLQTLLKHKLQWLVLLTALFGVSQGAWAHDWSIHGSWDNTDHEFENGTNQYTISLSANGTYTFNIRRNDGWWFGNNGTISQTESGCNWMYEANGNITTLKTKAAGNYVFEICWYGTNQIKLNVTFPSSCTTLTTSNYNQSGSWTQAYDGTQKSISISAKSGYPTGTTYYTGTNGTSYSKSSTAPTNPGQYKVTYETAATSTYCAANLEFGTLNITKTITIKVKQYGKYSSSRPYLYAWYGTDKTKSLGDWHGTQMSAASNGWYSLDVTYAASSVSLIINNNSNTQTGDITPVNANTCYQVESNGTSYAAVDCCTKPTAVSPSASSSSITLDASVNNALPSKSVTLSAGTTGGSGFTYSWSVSPTNNASFSATDEASPTLTFTREGQYTATLAAGCSSDTRSGSTTVTVLPNYLYVVGPLVNSTQNPINWDNGEPLTRTVSGSDIIYTRSWTSLWGSNNTNNKSFGIRHIQNYGGTAGSMVAQYSYDSSVTGVTITKGSGDITPTITYNAGDILILTVTYKGWNSTQSKPEYTYKLEKCVTAGISTGPSSDAWSGCGSSAVANELSVVATGTSPSYQWHVSSTNNFTPSDGTAIDGATEASYTPAFADISGGRLDTDYYYKCVVSVACGGGSTATSTQSGAHRWKTQINGCSISADESTVCSGATVTFTFSGAGGVTKILQKSTNGGSSYSDEGSSTTENPLTDAPTNINSANATVKYRAMITAASGCVTYTEPVDVTVKALPRAGSNAITFNNGNKICFGTTTTATAPSDKFLPDNTSVSWTSQDADILTIGSSTGAVSTVAPGATDIVCHISGNGCPEATKSATVAVMPMPTTSITGADYQCVGTSATYDAESEAKSVTIGSTTYNGVYSYSWDVSGTSWLRTTGATVTPAKFRVGTATGTVMVTPTLTTNGKACVGSQVTKSVSVKTRPSITTVTDGIRCGTGTVTLGATASDSNTGTLKIKWYDAATAGTLLQNDKSSTFTTPSISETTDYYVTVTNASTKCSATSRTQVTATVDPVPTITSQPSTGQLICTGTVPASISVTATGTDLSYQWMRKAPGDSDFTNMTGKNAATLSFSDQATTAGIYQYKCKITAGCGDIIYSDIHSIDVRALPSSGFTATGVYNGGDATWSTTFANDHRSAVLSTAQSATYYKWYGCNADGSGETASPANVTFSGENTSSCTATFNLPGTYYFKCKAGCSAGDAVSSSVVTVNVPYPSLGIAGPLFNEEWGYVAAGSDGLMTRSDLTWTKRFYCTFSGSDSKQFKVIQQYKGGTTTNSGWDNANRINGASCSVTGITKPDGTAWASGSNFFPASGLSLAAGDQVDLTVTMTGYNTYTVVLEKVCTPPTVYEISSESTAICSGGGGTITLSGSQSGYSYLLYNGIEPLTDKVKSGTGSAIDFSINSSGLYTAKAYYGSDPDACLTNMDGSIVMSISTTPKLVRTAQVVTNYTPVTVTSVSTDIETWTITGTATAYFYDQTANAITFKGSSTNSPYTITARTHGGCESSTTITVTDDTESCN